MNIGKNSLYRMHSMQPKTTNVFTYTTKHKKTATGVFHTIWAGHGLLEQVQVYFIALKACMGLVQSLCVCRLPAHNS